MTNAGRSWFLSQTAEEERDTPLIQPGSAPSAAPRDRDRIDLSTLARGWEGESCRASCLDPQSRETCQHQFVNGRTGFSRRPRTAVRMSPSLALAILPLAHSTV